MSNEDDLLVEAACSAWRPESTDGTLRFHPAWYDLDEEHREEVFERTRKLREMEAALDPKGLSTTARAVMAKIRK